MKYDCSEKIPDEVIKEAFANADFVQFLGRSFNYIECGSIVFGGLDWWLPLKRVLPLVGITSQMLEPIFPLKKCRFPFNLKLFRRKNMYDHLDGFLFKFKTFDNLAKVLEKEIDVWKYNSSTGLSRWVYTAIPE